MEISKIQEGSRMTIVLDGRLDTITSKQLEQELRASIEGVTELVFDFDKVTYITSAGLRVLAVALKYMNRQGSMSIRNTQPEVREVFDLTGLSDIMNIE